MDQSTFSISSYLNKSGSTSWRVSGYFEGRRLRRNFKSRQEALAEKASLEIQALQEASGFKPVLTKLAEHQVREAEIVFSRVGHQAASLNELVEFALKNFRHPTESQPLDLAIERYLESKTKEFEQGNLSEPQLKHINWDLGRFQRDLEEQKGSFRNSCNYLLIRF